MIDVRHGDSREVIKTLAGASVDSVVCDPPYALVSIVKRFGKENAAPAKDGDVYARASRGFMGKQWDTGDTAFDPAFWRDVMRVMKPGAHLVAFGGTRTYHRLAVAIEDAGFEIRDQIGWLYGSGFPKSHDAAKAIDATLANGKSSTVAMRQAAMGDKYERYEGAGHFRDGTTLTKNAPNPKGAAYTPATDAARQWQGWGTALKPAWEPIVLARKPLIGTVAANVLAHGTGALNIDGCRIATDEDRRRNAAGGDNGLSGSGTFKIRERRVEDQPLTQGRWPANVIHDGSEEVVAAFPDSDHARGNKTAKWHNGKPATVQNAPIGGFETGFPGDEGSAARFFYSAKADADDRLGSKHPTVKPVDLMAYLCRLVTPPGGTVLDPFAGSGTTGMACMREGFRAILIEREAEYVADIRRRIAHVRGEDAPLFGGAA